MQIQTTTYPIEIMTADYQVAGMFSPRGNPAMFVNDQSVQAFTLSDATFTPLMPGANIGAVSAPTLYVPKQHAQILLVGELAPADASLLPKPLPLVCFTDTYAVRGTFHVGAETQPADLLSDTAGTFLSATDAEIYSLRPLGQAISGAADLLFINKYAIRGFHPAE